jgi:tetratricopeptide (TPR) repeat protein
MPLPARTDMMPGSPTPGAARIVNRRNRALAFQVRSGEARAAGLASAPRRAGLAGWALAFLASALLLAACGGEDLEKELSELRAQQDAGRAAETLDEFSELANRHPDHPEVNFRLGIAMIAAGRATEALFPLHKAAADEGLAVPAGIVLASTLAQTQNHAEALRAAERVLERDAENEAALLLKTSSAIELHDGAVALESADKLVAKAPDNSNYRLARAAALAESSRLDDAEALYKELVDADAQGELQPYIRDCTAYVRFLRDKRKDVERAVDAIESCIERRPDDVQIVAAFSGILEELERSEDLIRILEAALERKPDARALRDELISQLVQADRADEARERAEKWVQEFDDPASWRQVAVLRRRNGELEPALEAVDKAIALMPNPDEETRFFRAELLVELGRAEEAEKLIDSFESQLFKDVLNGRLAQERGDQKRALELYGKASTDWPQNWGLRVLAARAAFALGDTERAKSDLLEATRQAPKETDAALWLAHVYFSEGNFRQCLQFTARHLKERGPVDAGAHVLRAEALAATNRMPEAIKTLDELAEVRDGEYRATAWAAAARLEARSDPAAALKQLDARLAKQKLDLGAPENVAALNQLFDLFIQTERLDEARKRLDALLAKQPESAHLYGLRGRAALVQGRIEDAEKDFARALELAPEDGAALSGLALLERQRGDLPKAIETMKQAAKASPQSPEYGYMAARMTLDLGDRAEARKMFESVLRDQPGQVGAANDLAFLLAEDATDLPLAQRYAERAVRLQPSPETLDTLGYVKLRQGAAEEAVGLFERALARQPEYATARYHLALALIEKGEPVAARQALEEALARPFPEQQEARKVLARIDSGEVQP